MAGAGSGRASDLRLQHRSRRTKDRQVPGLRLEEFQRHYIRLHCVGLGEFFDVETVRAAILARANSLASGYSGVRVTLVESLLELLNRGVHPAVPQIGSLGASGDLAPLAHVGAVLTGEPSARVYWKGRPARLEDLPEEVRPEPLTLAPKEAMALTNGTSFMLAVLTLVLEEGERLLETADVAAALSLEAMLGERDAFDARLQAVRGHRGQESCARRLRALLAGGEATGEALRLEYLERKVRGEVARQSDLARESGIEPAGLERFRIASEHSPRVQDAYSLRCVPQVHGASADALEHVAGIVDRELNAVTDNPLIFPDAGGYRPLSGGNFHGQPLAMAADYAAIALAELGSISERRLYRLLNSELSYGLPPNLTGGEPGINTGLMLTQYTAAALVSESKALCHPASVDSIPTSGDQEDHVSMGLWACRKARLVLENSRRIVALELLAAAQGLDLQEKILGRARTVGAGARRAYREVRASGVGLLEEDRYLEDDMGRMVKMVREDRFLEAVRAACAEGGEEWS
ncbi:MAG: aromatic amino acid lyase [Candidatus Eisenbacteria bacterium]